MLHGGGCSWCFARALLSEKSALTAHLDSPHHSVSSHFPSPFYHSRSPPPTLLSAPRQPLFQMLKKKTFTIEILRVIYFVTHWLLAHDGRVFFCESLTRRGDDYPRAISVGVVEWGEDATEDLDDEDDVRWENPGPEALFTAVSEREFTQSLWSDYARGCVRGRAGRVE